MLMVHNSFMLLIFAEAFTFLGRYPPVLQLFAYDMITVHVAS